MRYILDKLRGPNNIVIVVAVLTITGILLNFLSDQLTSWSLMQQSLQNDTVNIYKETPYVILPDGSMTNQIQRGHSFYIHYHYKRSELCDYVTNTSAKQQGGINAGIALRTAENWFLPGDYEFSERFEMPGDAPLGKYTITKHTINHCANHTYYSNNYQMDVYVQELPAQPVDLTVDGP